MDESSINLQSRLALFRSSITLVSNVSDFSLGKISINVKGDRLYLLGILPARDGNDQMKQARIPLGRYDVPADYKVVDSAPTFRTNGSRHGRQAVPKNKETLDVGTIRITTTSLNSR